MVNEQPICIVSAPYCIGQDTALHLHCRTVVCGPHGCIMLSSILIEVRQRVTASKFQITGEPSSPCAEVI